MKEPSSWTLSEADAGEYASWFRCLADATRIRVLHAVAAAGRAVTVGEIVEIVGRSQSTVSTHLRILAEQEFVVMEPDGIRTLVSINDDCMSALPRAAISIMAAAPSDERSDP